MKKKTFAPSAKTSAPSALKSAGLRILNAAPISKVIKDGPVKLTVAFDKADSETPAEILIYDDIGKDPWTGEGITAKDIVAALNEITPRGRDLRMRINSRGGDVNEGKAIRAQLEDWPGRIVNVIDGVAASTASWMIPADETHARNASQIFIHKSWAMVVGNSDDMKKAVAMLDLTDGQIADIYAKQTGKAPSAMLQLMADETLLTGKQAKELGFVNELIDEPALHNFSPEELTTMRNKLAALNTIRPESGRPGPQPTLSDAQKQGAGKNNQPQPKTIIMNREKMLALLNKWGVTIPANATDDQLMELIEAGPTNAAGVRTSPAAAVPDPNIVDLKNELEELKKERTRERTNRITRDLDQLVIEDKITSEEAKEWLPKCIADETILNTLAKRQPMLGGTEPLRAIRPSDMKTARDAINAKDQGKCRFEFIRDNWNSLKNGIQVMPDPRNANTLDSALTTAMLASGLITVLQNRLPQLRAFTRDFGTDRMKPLAVVQVPIATAGGTAQTNATSFEDTTNFVASVDNRAVTVERITSGGHLTTAELNSGFRMEQFVLVKAHELADAIQGKVNAVITTGNFASPAAVTSAVASFGIDELGTVWSNIAKASIKNIMLRQDAYKNFLPANMESFNPLTGNTMPGWDGFFLNTYWTGATSGTYGFGCNPQAIATAAGLPLASPRRSAAGVSAQTVELPGIGLSVELQEWYATAGKVDWANWEVMFGAALGDATAGNLIKTP